MQVNKKGLKILNAVFSQLISNGSHLMVGYLRGLRV